MKIKLSKYVLIFLCALCIIKCTPNATDFTYFFDDNSIVNDRIISSSIPESNEIFYGSYYFSDGSSVLSDPRNGMNVVPINNVN